MIFEIIGGNEDSMITITEQKEENGIFTAVIKMCSNTERIPNPFSIQWKFPIVDTYSVWSANHWERHTLGPDWSKRSTWSRLASGMPLHAILSIKGTNRMTIALSDAYTPTCIRTGVCEEDANLSCCVDFFTVPVAPIKEYTAILRIDFRPLPFYDIIQDVVFWWEKDCGYESAYVPESAKLPMNSLWYSYHQRLDIEDILKECILAKEIGMDTLIVDDGWQTDDTNRGYSFCGDWEVAAGKIPDMKEFVKRVHDTGMKFILWYSVPFIGCQSKNYSRFKDMLLDQSGNNTTYWCLDPRYKEAREFLISNYVSAVTDWNLDGLKLDMIDTFVLKGKSLEFDPRRDFQSLEDAINCLMTQIITKLRSINPQIMIEFRESYVGPAIRKFGNILRVIDCPNDAIMNRREVINLRLTSGSTAVHSDMLMWNLEDAVESAAVQFASILYAVPQISVKIQNLREDHRKMLAYYLKFWKENRNVLLEGRLQAWNPESEYSLVCASNHEKAILTAYIDKIIPGGISQELIVVNVSANETLLFDGYKGRSYQVLNCMGEILEEGTLQNDINKIAVPLSGMVYIYKM